jgi:hypothetical protein
MQIIVTPYYLVCFQLFNDGKQWGGRFVHGVDFYAGSKVGRENS